MAEHDDGFTPEVLERIIHAALKQRDFEGVVHALRILTVRDPHRASLIYDTIQVGLAIAAERDA